MARIAGKDSYPKMSEEMFNALKKGNTSFVSEPSDCGNLESPQGNETLTQKSQEKKTKKKPTIADENFDKMVELFGPGFNSQEYKSMYDKFVTLQNNYPLKTKMHEEALITYVKYAFKRDKAISDDDIEAADKWGKLASKQANDAKINPSQLSAADLSDGMTCFSQVSATVEKAQDIIPLLNVFIEKPQDRVDYTIWQYVNYCRHLEGKPLCQYKDLYNFLKKRFEEYKMDYTFLFDEGDGKFDTNDLGD